MVKKKINELKNNQDINYEAHLLEKNIKLKNENDVLLQTIKFNNFNELKDNLPSLKNYENNTNKRSINNNNKSDSNSIDYKSKNKSLDALILKSKQKKNLINKNISFSKENENPNHFTQINNNNLEENSILNLYTKKNFSNSKLKKNNSMKGKKHPSYIVIPTNEKRGKKILKDFEKIMELKKIKEILKINRKKEKSFLKTERSKNELNKKILSNLLRNQTDNNKKKFVKKIKEINNTSKFVKSKSKKKYINLNIIPNLMKRVNTEQKNYILNKIHKLNFSKIIQKIVLIILIIKTQTIQKKQKHY